jgi:hypothetical protein
VVSIERSPSKGEAGDLSAEFDRSLSCESPFKFPPHLGRSLGIDGIIPMVDVIFITLNKKIKKENRSCRLRRDMDLDTHRHRYRHPDRH